MDNRAKSSVVEGIATTLLRSGYGEWQNPTTGVASFRGLHVPPPVSLSERNRRRRWHASLSIPFAPVRRGRAWCAARRIPDRPAGGWMPVRGAVCPDRRGRAWAGRCRRRSCRDSCRRCRPRLSAVRRAGASGRACLCSCGTAMRAVGRLPVSVGPAPVGGGVEQLVVIGGVPATDGDPCLRVPVDPVGHPAEYAERVDAGPVVFT